MKKKEDHELLIYNKNFIDAWKNAFNGIKHGITSQVNIRIQIVVGIFMILLGVFFGLSKIEWICLMFSIFLVLLAEMVNTAIEATVDLCTSEYHPKAKIAKDVAAGSVVISVLNAVVLGVFLFGDKIVLFVTNLIR